MIMIATILLLRVTILQVSVFVRSVLQMSSVRHYHYCCCCYRSSSKAILVPLLLACCLFYNNCSTYHHGVIGLLPILPIIEGFAIPTSINTNTICSHHNHVISSFQRTNLINRQRIRGFAENRKKSTTIRATRGSSVSSLLFASNSVDPSNDDENNVYSTNYYGTPNNIRSTSQGTVQPNIQQQQAPNYRSIRRIEKFARLPVWPVVNGVLIWILSKIFGNDIAAKVEDTITGRVSPNFYTYVETDPFIMLVHHCHSFQFFDPIRYIQRALILPEGFPAHPHRGFITVTYILHGGFIHRDSLGIQQKYGNDNNNSKNDSTKYNGKHTQWLVTGSGLLHEEMFDLPSSEWNSRQELYQIWLNVPSQNKMDQPQSILLGGPNETPTVIDTINKCQTVVLAGSYNNGNSKSSAPTLTDLVIFHVQLEQKGSKWIYNIPSNYETAFLYVRRGSSVRVVNGDENNISNNYDGESIIPVHHTAYLTSKGTQLIIEAINDASDFLFLAGQPIGEPCVARGSMVMTSELQINQAYIDNQNGKFGIPWDHKLSNDEWIQSIQRKF